MALGVRSRQGVHGRVPGRAAGRATRAPTTSAGARCCRGCWCGSRITRASTASSGSSATATGFPRNGANSTSSTNSRGCAAGSASSSCSARATFSRPGVCLEQEYLKTLLLMRLDSGNFTPDQVEWIAQQLEDWSPSLSLVAAARQRRELLRRPHRHAGPAAAGPAARGRTRAVSRRGAGLRAHRRAACAGCPSRTTTSPTPGELPSREQRLLLMRLASLFGPDALAHAPRAARYAIDTEVRVVIGLQALTRAVAEIDRLPEAARSRRRRRELRRSHPDRESRRQPGVGRAAHSRARCGGSRTAATRAAGSRRRSRKRRPSSGEILAIRDGDAWSLAVVRRMQRQQVDEVTVGVEIIARRLVRVLLRNWVDADRRGVDRRRSAFLRRLPARARRQPAGDPSAA